MKKIINLLIVWISICYPAKAQADWQCVHPERKVYFENIYKEVYCIRIDSTLNDNKILYPFSDLHEDSYSGCWSDNLGSWLTKYIVINEDENTVFITGEDRQVLIKNKSGLNEVWDMFENNSIKVKGKLSSIDSKSILGVEDLVKTITFSVYNKNDEPIEHPLNKKTIEISENFGLVKTISFYYFGSNIEYNLIGINEPQLGFYNFNSKELYFDFQPDDEFHIYKNTSSHENPKEEKIINRYISRTDYEDRIEYSYEQRINSNDKKDTLYQVIIKGETLFDTEPNEPYFNDVFEEFRKVFVFNTPIPKKFYRIFPVYWEDVSSCWSEIIICGGCIPGYDYNVNYFVGLGGPYWECCINMWGYDCNNLVYYKKGDIEYGTPFDFTNISENIMENDFIIYPNPANNYIKIMAKDNSSFDGTIIEIYDIYGRNVFCKYLDDNGIIDTSFLVAGHYIVKIIQNNKNITNLKFIKQ